MRESAIEHYLVRRVKAAGGEARKLKGRRNEPDRLVLFRPGRVFFVECKAPGEEPRRGQRREHARLRALGFVVLVLDTKEKVDAFVRGVVREHKKYMEVAP